MTFPLSTVLLALAVPLLTPSVATAQPARPGASVPAGTAAVDTTIDIMAMGSTLAFETTEIAVKQGKRVRLRFMNHGTLPHNLVIAKTDADVDVLAEAAGAAYETGFVPVQMKERMIGYTALASPGETVEFIFVVPPAGTYTYVCLISGHYNSMLGTLRSLK